MYDSQKQVVGDLFKIQSEFEQVATRLQDEGKRLGENGKSVLAAVSRMEKMQEEMKHHVAHLSKMALLDEMKAAFTDLETSTVLNTSQQDRNMEKLNELMNQMQSITQNKNKRY